MPVPSQSEQQNGRRSEVIRLRVTPEQKRLLQQAAEAQDASLSAWLRHIGLQLARKEAVITPTERMTKTVSGD